MQNFIKSANLNLLNGLLKTPIEFLPSLNLISGENGTLKTKMLQALRTEAHLLTLCRPGEPLRFQSISPKRNSERRAVEAAFQAFRQQNRNWNNELQQTLGRQINNNGFDTYLSVGEMFILIFEDRTADGGDRIKHMQQVTDEFNTVIQSVFPEYVICSEWDGIQGAPKLTIRKNRINEFPLHELSLGEQEVLSLLLALHTARDSVDVYLIDEPEVHLNWNLEIKLFEFIDKLCTLNNKQAIIVTHSRAIFRQRFIERAQFLVWNEEGRIECRKQLSSEQRKALAGDAIEMVALGDFSTPVVFVEDGFHADTIGVLCDLFDTKVRATKCGNSQNVKSLFDYQRSQGTWANSFFLVDSDNQGNPYPNESRFIFLNSYCLENIFLDPGLLASLSGRSAEDSKLAILNAVLAKKGKIFKKTKSLEFLLDKLEAEDMTLERLATFDASEILDDVCGALGLKCDVGFLKSYLAMAQERGRIAELLPSSLIALFQQKDVL